jgi:hypothetical protein
MCVTDNEVPQSYAPDVPAGHDQVLVGRRNRDLTVRDSYTVDWVMNRQELVGLSSSDSNDGASHCEVERHEDRCR